MPNHEPTNDPEKALRDTLAPGPGKTCDKSKRLDQERQFLKDQEEALRRGLPAQREATAAR